MELRVVKQGNWGNGCELHIEVRVKEDIDYVRQALYVRGYRVLAAKPLDGAPVHVFLIERGTCDEIRQRLKGDPRIAFDDNASAAYA